MPSFSAVITPVLAIGALGVAIAAHTGSGGGDDGSAEVAELRGRLDAAETERNSLRVAVGLADRQIRGLSSDLAAVRVLVDQRDGSAEALTADEADVPGDDGASAAAIEDSLAGMSEGQLEKLAEVFATEKGQEVLARAARRERERAEGERWDRRVDMMVDRFAAKANLDERQIEQMKEISGAAMKEIREVWTSMRDADLPAEERANLVAENRVKMEEIQTKTSEKMKTILDADQYQMYEDDMDRMRGAWGGGRGGGRGGRGGDGGLR